MNNESDHYCLYAVIRKTKQSYGGSIHLVERCRCGRYIITRITLSVDDQVAPSMIKSWYYADGTLDKVTGCSITSSAPNVDVNHVSPDS